MRVIYGDLVKDMSDAMLAALNDNRTIARFEVTPDEWKILTSLKVLKYRWKSHSDGMQSLDGYLFNGIPVVEIKG